MVSGRSSLFSGNEFEMVTGDTTNRFMEVFHYRRYDSVQLKCLVTCPQKWKWALDACYDRGGSFRLKMFLNDGAPSPEIVGEKKNNRPTFFSWFSLCIQTTGCFIRYVAVFFFLLQKSFLLGEVLSSRTEETSEKKWCTSIVAWVVTSTGCCFSSMLSYRRGQERARREE